MPLPPLRARVCSDLHLDTCALQKSSLPPADLAIVAGDVRNGQPLRVIADLLALFDEPLILFTPGNHEGYDERDWDDMVESLRGASQGTRVRVLSRNAIEHQGRRFVGATLWTDFRLFGSAKAASAKELTAQALARADYGRIRIKGELIQPEDTELWHRLDLAWLKAELAQPFDGPSIAITHHAPSQRSVAPLYARDLVSAAFASRLPEALLSQARVWIHGHMHSCFDYMEGACRVICNPRGYARNPCFSGENPAFTVDYFIDL